MQVHDNEGLLSIYTKGETHRVDIKFPSRWPNMKEILEDAESVEVYSSPGTVTEDPLVQVSYIIATGGSGLTRMRLSKIPQWLGDPLHCAPGTLIHSLKVLK